MSPTTSRAYEAIGHRLHAWYDDWEDPADVIANLADYSAFPLATALVFSALAHTPDRADAGHLEFYGALAAAYGVAVLINTALMLISSRCLDEPGEQATLANVVPQMRSHAATIVLVAVFAIFYLELGGWGVLFGFWALFQYILTLVREIHHREQTKEIEKQAKQLEVAHVEAVDALVAAVHARDGTTGDHIDRCVDVTAALYQRVTGNEADPGLRYGLKAHDVGKIGTPDAILNKPGQLTDGERHQMQEHPETGRRIVEPLSFVGKEGVDVILHHHEKWDGSGYPDGLAGEDIPLVARMLSVVDAYDAMTSDRPYRRALTHDQAIAELHGNAGTQFDPGLVAEFVAMVRESPSLVSQHRQTRAA